MAVSQFGTRIGRLAKKTPASAKDIELWAYANLGLRVSDESIRKALNGDIDPTQCAVELLMAVAAFYDVEPQDLGHHAESRLQAVLTYAGRSGPDDSGGLGGVNRAWNGDNVVDLGARRADVIAAPQIAA